MREEKDINDLLEKFILNQCSEKEINTVIEYFRRRTDSTGLLSVEEVMEMIDDIPAMEEASADRIYNKIISISEKQRKEPSIRLFWKSTYLRYAAAIALICIMSAGYIVWQNLYTEPRADQGISVTANGVLTTPEEAITLEKENGQFEVIHPNGSRIVLDARGNVIGEQEKGVLRYEGGTETKSLIHNTLTVPYGKRFKVVLSDGTSVHLNAGTSLKYPVKFLEGEEVRKVYVKGEAFFDVVSDPAHPFIVNTGDLDVRVLGTQFNVSNYPEDQTTDVVLVEGSVRMQQEDAQQKVASDILLEPGEKGQFDKAKYEMSKRRVVTSLYTAWMKGELVFRNMAFEDILKKLERHYNISIENQNTTLANEIFNASFGDEPVEKVLENLSTIYGIEFTIKDKKLIVQ